MPDAGALDAEREALVRLSAAVATRDERRIDDALRRADTAATAGAVEEVLLQSHLFVGFPTALEAMVRWRAICRDPAPAPAPEPPALWEARGPLVCERVYGANYAKLRHNVAALHPALDAWMVVGGYGRVIGRPGLPLATRELCIAALLAVWDAPRQLHSHLRGALNVGAGVAEVARAVEIACEFLDPPRAARVQGLWTEVAERHPTSAHRERSGAGDADS